MFEHWILGDRLGRFPTTIHHTVALLQRLLQSVSPPHQVAALIKAQAEPLKVFLKLSPCLSRNPSYHPYLYTHALNRILAQPNPNPTATTISD